MGQGWGPGGECEHGNSGGNVVSGLRRGGQREQWNDGYNEPPER